MIPGLRVNGKSMVLETCFRRLSYGGAVRSLITYMLLIAYCERKWRLNCHLNEIQGLSLNSLS